MKTSRLLVCVVVRIVVLGINVLALRTSLAQAPLPSDISLISPSPTIAHNIAAFSGAWRGAWGGSFPTALVVEQINQDGTARVIYSWGDELTSGIKAGWIRLTGKISSGKLHFLTPHEAAVDFEFERNGNLSGQYKFRDTPPSFVELVRIPSTDPSVIIATARKPVVSWEEIRIPEYSHVGPTAGKPLTLQTTLYRLPSPEPHPVVIINHGSTGPGVVPVSEVYRAGNEASFYRSLGYIVVVPMRKGRGASDGTFFEESEDQAVELDSAIEDLNAVVEFMTKQPDVDPTRIVVTGVSRGGLLAVAYAERYPTNVIGVINFSGGWWGEHTPNADFNFEEFRKAGRNAKIPMLWLYADHDSYYSLDFVEREFAVFRSAGGRGDLFEVRDLPGEGHFLCAWLDRWQVKVTDYLKEINKMLNQSPPPSSNSVPVTLPTSKTSGVVPILHP